MNPFTEYEPLLGQGFHELSLKQLEVICVSNFPNSETRLTIFKNIKGLFSKIEEQKLSLEIWLNGSFLTKKFQEATKYDHRNICSYRLFNENSKKFSLSSIGSLLTEFQNLFTTIFGSIQNKDLKKITANIKKDSELIYHFTYPGSLGIAMSIEVERVICIENDLTKAMKLMVDMLNADSSDQMHYFAREYNSKCVNALSNWVKNQIKYNLCAEIKWLNDTEVIYESILNSEHLLNMDQAIKETSNENIEEIEMIGTLIGADTSLHNFHMAFNDHDEIKGKMLENLGKTRMLEIPQKYKATLRKETYENYAENKIETKYILKKLEDILPPPNASQTSPSQEA
jgi:hypothetical protein